jgi:hypothetical protein
MLEIKSPNFKLIIKSSFTFSTKGELFTSSFNYRLTDMA